MVGQDTKPGQSLELYFEGLGVEYQIIDYSLENVDVPSPLGKYVATGYGIFLTGSDTLFRWVPGNFISWYYDDSGVVFTQGEYYYYNGLFSSRFRIPRPILKLKLPSAPTDTSAP